MSNFLAIATVTETLKQMFEATLSKDVPGSHAAAVKPAELGEKGVNIYLYQVRPNASWRNDDLPTRSGDSKLVKRPRAALDLYYLLTFYGEEAHLEPQRILGSVMSTLHARPVLTRQQIRDAINHAEDGFLNGSDLADEIELVKLTPLPLSIEELYNLWSGFFQVPYTLSVAYQASVIFIEGKDIPRRALPVRDRDLYVVPLRRPLIEQVESEQGPDWPIVAESKVIVKGRNLRGDVTYALVGNSRVEPDAISEEMISIALPASLKAGIQSIQIIHEMMMGRPPEAHRGNESNASAFVLRPSITGINNEARTINVNPAIGKGQRVVLFLNELAEASPAAYSFTLPAPVADVGMIAIPDAAVKAGEYLVQIQVDGANSPLAVKDDSYAGPKLVIA